MSAAAGEARATGGTGAFRAALAEELRVHMTRKQVTGRELARRLHVSSQWISQRTRAVVPMDTDDMEMIAGALGITLTELTAEAARKAAQTAASGGYRSDSGVLLIDKRQVKRPSHLHAVRGSDGLPVTRTTSTERTSGTPRVA